MEKKNNASKIVYHSNNKKGVNKQIDDLDFEFTQEAENMYEILKHEAGMANKSTPKENKKIQKKSK